MIEIKAPQDFNNGRIRPLIFLAGSIEMGVAEKWQDRVVASLHEFEGTVLNPRRDDWDSSWEQSIENPQFREQVEWELEAQNKADMVLMYFLPGTKSPITLLELGILTSRPARLFVCCPEGFWRKGNVDVVCDQYGIRQVKVLSDFVSAVRFFRPRLSPSEPVCILPAPVRRLN